MIVSVNGKDVAAAIRACVPTSDSWQTIRDGSLRFLESPWPQICIDAGWTGQDVWVSYAKPDIALVRRRLDAAGLVCGLLLGMSCSIHEITPAGAWITRRRTGATLFWRRTPTAHPGHMLPWWESAALARVRTDIGTNVAPDTPDINDIAQGADYEREAAA